ncbi:hypothetical protein BGZ93_009291, partial [Podila epicladia]
LQRSIWKSKCATLASSAPSPAQSKSWVVDAVIQPNAARPNKTASPSSVSTHLTASIS